MGKWLFNSLEQPLASNSIAGWKYGFRSGLEEAIAQQIQEAGLEVRYEHPDDKIQYIKPERKAKYSPDFVLTKSNGKPLIVESKGRFLTADRQKHLLIKDQFPDYDIRFVFSNSRQKIAKGSKTTYAMWCERHGFVYADKLIPVEWLTE